MIWLVSFPLSRYVENVVALAKENKLEIIDIIFKDKINPALVAETVPELTLKSSIVEPALAAEIIPEIAENSTTEDSMAVEKVEVKIKEKTVLKKGKK